MKKMSVLLIAAVTLITLVTACEKEESFESEKNLELYLVRKGDIERPGEQGED